MRTSEAAMAAMSVLNQDLRQSGKGLARGLEPASDPENPGVRVIHSTLTMPYATIERPCLDT